MEGLNQNLPRAESFDPDSALYLNHNQTTTTMKAQKRYYIFGTELVNAYNDSEYTLFEIGLKLAKQKLSGTVYKFDPEVNNPTELIDVFDGWDKFEEINRDEYEELTHTKPNLLAILDRISNRMSRTINRKPYARIIPNDDGKTAKIQIVDCFENEIDNLDIELTDMLWIDTLRYPDYQITRANWEAIEKYLPNYSKHPQVSYSDTLEQIVTSNIESDTAQNLLKKEFNGDPLSPIPKYRYELVMHQLCTETLNNMFELIPEITLITGLIYKDFDVNFLHDHDKVLDFAHSFIEKFPINTNWEKQPTDYESTVFKEASGIFIVK